MARLFAQTAGQPRFVVLDFETDANVRSFFAVLSLSVHRMTALLVLTKNARAPARVARHARRN
jgi:hypothetical protein